MGVSKLIQDAIKTISEQAVSVAPYDKTRGGVIKGMGDVPNTYNVQVDGVVYTNVKTTGGIAPSINDTVTVIFPTNNSSQMVINSVSTQSWIKGASDFIYPVGAYYWTSDGDFDPNVSFSGTWEKIDAGVTLVSAGTGYTVSSGTAKDGGSPYIQAHKHGFTNPTIASSGGHSHNGTRRPINTTGGSSLMFVGANASESDAQSARVTRSDSQGEHSHSYSTNGTVNAVSDLPSGQTTGDAGNMPPYKCAYCWHRIL